MRGAALKARLDEVLEIIGLTERQKSRVGTFSGGMKRRVNNMDEPAVGIDPQSRRHILDAVKELNHQGMTVRYTTHYIEEAQELSDQIAIMDQGQVIACGNNEALIKIVGEMDRIDLTLEPLRFAASDCPPLKSDGRKRPACTAFRGRMVT